MYFRGTLVGFVILMFLKDLSLPVNSAAVDSFSPLARNVIMTFSNLKSGHRTALLRTPNDGYI